MAHVSHKLQNAFEGALAGGGDPATSPLYVFGPFLKLIVVAGVASVTFGASVWLVVFTIATVSAMYRLVMAWVTDGSGGSGLSEEEFGGWAVKANAAITVIEYTLTFLVSMAAMVTFIADRVPLLNESILGIQYRAFVAIILSILTGWLVNRGPKTAARAFGPATGAVLLLLWTMIFATIWKQGFRLPDFNLEAFTPSNLRFTFGGFARMLAVMTGIEVFANLVAAYEGPPEVKSRKAFGSLLIIMGSTAVTMLVVGPAIFELSDPTNEHVSVFTQTMDQLLPTPLPLVGTLVGIAVLLSASAASAQGLQNLALGLTNRHYVPAFVGQRNRFDVADKPVWMEVGVCCLCFLVFGTSEETYLAIYAAGVFILLSMTSWAVTKRLLRRVKEVFSGSGILLIAGTMIAAVLTSSATVIIFEERFIEGAWIYVLLIPVLYVLFTYFRNTIGAPSVLREQLGAVEEAMWGVGLGSGRPVPAPVPTTSTPAISAVRRLVPAPGEGWRRTSPMPHHLLVTLDGSPFAEQVLPVAKSLSRGHRSHITLVSVIQPGGAVQFLSSSEGGLQDERLAAEAYLSQVMRRLTSDNGLEIDYVVGDGPVVGTINRVAADIGADLILTSTHGRSGVQRWLLGSMASKIIRLSETPVILIRPLSGDGREEMAFNRLLVPLDGSEFSERVLPYVRSMGSSLGCQVLLLTVPEVPEAATYGAMAGAVEALRAKAEVAARSYLGGIARALTEDGLDVQALVTGSRPAQTIAEVSQQEGVDLIMMATHGRGGLDRVLVGSVAERLAQQSQVPIFLLPIREQREP